MATSEELQARPERFACDGCTRRTLWTALWPENRTAWDCYQALMAHRTVRDAQAGAWVLESYTAGWSWRRKADLLARVDLILEILQPAKRPDPRCSTSAVAAETTS